MPCRHPHLRGGPPGGGGPAEGLWAALASRAAGELHPGPGPVGKGDRVRGIPRGPGGHPGSYRGRCTQGGPVTGGVSAWSSRARSCGDRTVWGGPSWAVQRLSGGHMAAGAWHRERLSLCQLVPPAPSRAPGVGSPRSRHYCAPAGRRETPPTAGDPEQAPRPL